MSLPSLFLIFRFFFAYVKDVFRPLRDEKGTHGAEGSGAHEVVEYGIEGAMECGDQVPHDYRGDEACHLAAHVDEGGCGAGDGAGDDFQNDSNSRTEDAGLEEVHAALEDHYPEEGFRIVHEVQENGGHGSADGDEVLFFLVEVFIHHPSADSGGQEGCHERNRCHIAHGLQVDPSFSDEVGRHPGVQAFIDAGNAECADYQFPDHREMKETEEVLRLILIIRLGFFLRSGLFHKDTVEEYINKPDNAEDLEHAAPSEPEDQGHDDDRSNGAADVVGRKDAGGKGGTELPGEVFRNGPVAGAGVRSFAEAEDEPEEQESRQGRCMAGGEGKDGPQGEGDHDHRLGPEMVRQPAAGDLHNGIADEKGTDHHAHFRGGQVKVLGNGGQRQPYGGTIDIGYTESYVQKEKYHIPVLTL